MHVSRDVFFKEEKGWLWNEGESSAHTTGTFIVMNNESLAENVVDNTQNVDENLMSTPQLIVADNQGSQELVTAGLMARVTMKANQESLDWE